ncbi:hypothetical protein CDL15_Pgr012614 [Punica granatum]|uniref:Uncharacterized protein n=1 Tax=Punica granatum TaxID=22663 RepID=A0A218XY45_PUNGR|nr:hypothetical protein CDL15_Pgr012614 [Punica granatum]
MSDSDMVRTSPSPSRRLESVFLCLTIFFIVVAQIQWDPHGVGLLTMRLGLLSFGWQLKHVVGGMGSPGCGSGPHLISIQRHGEALMVEASRSLPEVVLPLFDGPTNPRAETYCMLRPFESR